MAHCLPKAACLTLPILSGTHSASRAVHCTPMAIMAGPVTHRPALRVPQMAVHQMVGPVAVVMGLAMVATVDTGLPAAQADEEETVAQTEVGAGGVVTEEMVMGLFPPYQEAPGGMEATVSVAGGMLVTAAMGVRREREATAAVRTWVTMDKEALATAGPVVRVGMDRAGPACRL